MTSRPSPRPAIVEARGLCLTLHAASGAINILSGVDLTVAAGEQVAIMGPSGAGKTSLVMLLAGLERPTAGVVRIAGQDLAVLDEDGLARFRRGRIGIVFQAFHLIPTMTALENVMVPLELAGRADARPRAEAALAAVGLCARADHLPGQLSGGEQQRAAIARAVVGEPALILADEPTGNLDGAAGAAVIDLLFALSAVRGATLMLITHERELAQRCGRIIRLESGCVVG